MKMEEICLGDKVRCKYTGFTGVVLATTKFINGCVQHTVAPRAKRGESYPTEVSIDEESLEVIKPVGKKVKPTSGGPTTVGHKIRGY